MLYMLLPVHGSRPRARAAGMAMAGMGASAGPAGSFPVLAVILALFMLGYIVWTTDRLASLARARVAAAGPGRDRPVTGSGPGGCAPARAGDAPVRRPPPTRRGDQAGGPVLAPGLAACGKLAMSITMGYMLILML